MTKVSNVLIVEHEGLLVDVLKDAFTKLNTKGNQFKLRIASTCSDALTIIKRYKSIDLALLNINIPPCDNDKVVFIEDICLKLRFTFPKVKMLLFSSYKNNTYLDSLLKTINPECLLVKSDINFTELLEAIERIASDIPYYSKTVLHHIRRRMANRMVIDPTDKAILYYLSIGTKMKDLPKLVNLSISTIESRKRKLKAVFNIEQKGDYYLIQKATEQGFL